MCITWKAYYCKNIVASNLLKPKKRKRKHSAFCIYCPKAYSWLKHRVRKHGEEKYHCPYCIKRFFRWKNLYCHLHIHEKPFLCKICKEKFYKKCLLRWHLIHKHFQKPCCWFPSIC